MSVNRLTPAGLKRRLELERAQKSFLEHPGAEGAAEVFELPADGRITIGRDDRADVVIEGDEQVSRVHAELERVGGSWVISDDGLSRNGTWIGDTRIAGRRRLARRRRDPDRPSRAACSATPLRQTRGRLQPRMTRGRADHRHATPGPRRPVPTVQRRLGIRGAGDEQGDRGGGVPLDRGGEGAPQGAVRPVWSERSSSESEAPEAC